MSGPDPCPLDATRFPGFKFSFIFLIVAGPFIRRWQILSTSDKKRNFWSIFLPCFFENIFNLLKIQMFVRCARNGIIGTEPAGTPGRLVCNSGEWIDHTEKGEEVPPTPRRLYVEGVA
jgi:hypothetical protein